MKRFLSFLLCVCLLPVPSTMLRGEDGDWVLYDYDCENMDPPPGEPEDSGPDDEELDDDNGEPQNYGDENGGELDGRGEEPQAESSPSLDDEPIKEGDPIHPGTANLERRITDLQTFGASPIAFSRHYNSRTTNFGDAYNELGNKQTWQHNWSYEVRQLQTKTYGFFDIKVRYANGQEYNYTAADASGNTLVPQANVGDRLYRWSGTKVGYTLATSKGAEMDFPRTTSPKFQLTQARDNQGTKLNFTYEATGQMKQITNNFGRWIAIDHETGPNGVVRIKGLRSNDGRQVNYNYSDWTSQGTSVLTKVNYPGNLEANYTYVGAEHPTSGAGRPLLAAASDHMLTRNAGATIAMTYNYEAKFNYGSGPYLVTGTARAQSNLRSGGMMVTLPGGGGGHPKILKGDGSEVHRKFANGLATGKKDGAGRTTNYQRGTGGYGFITGKVRANGASTSYVRNSTGRITQRTNPQGGVLNKTYNGSGFVLTKTDERGNSLVITRGQSGSGNHKATRVDLPDGTHLEATYNGDGQTLTRKARNGGTTLMAYYNGGEAGGAQGDLKAVTDARGKTTTFTYNAAGLRSSVTNPLGHTLLMTYDARGQVTNVTHHDGTSRTLEYDNFGNPTRSTDELGHVSTTAYNEYNRVASRTDAAGRTTTYEYGLAPSAGANGAFRGTVSRVTLGSGRKVDFTYDASERMTQMMVGAGTPEALTTTFGYDVVGRRAMTTDALGKITQHPTDTLGRPTSRTDALGSAITYTHDPVGNFTGGTLPSGGQFVRTYDSLNRQTGTTNANNNSVSFNYAVGGNQNIRSLVDARGNSYVTNLDPNGHQLSFVHPDGSQESATYNSIGKPSTYTNRANAVRTNAYDSSERLIASSWSDGITPTVSLTYDAAGNPTMLDNGVSRVTCTYDASNRLTSETQLVAGNPAGAQTVSYGYDGEGQLASTTYPDGTLVAYARNGRGQVGTVTVNGSLLATYQFDAAGRHAGKILANGVTETISYDDAGQVAEVRANNAAGTLLARSGYARDTLGNVATVTHEDGTADRFGYDATSQLTSASYGNLVSSSGAPPQRALTYTFDPAGNQQSLVATDAGGASRQTNFVANNLNQYTGASLTGPANSGNQGTGSLVMQHDGNANLALVRDTNSGLSTSLAYDAGNRLTSVTANWSVATSGGSGGSGGSGAGLRGYGPGAASLVLPGAAPDAPEPVPHTMNLAYDALHRKVSTTVDGVTTFHVHAGAHLIADLSGTSGTQVAKHIVGARTDEILTSTTAAGGTFYHHHDALGSVTHLTNAGGQVIERYNYDAYGAAIIQDVAGNAHSTSTVGNRFLFTGREELPVGGLYDYRNRVYSPVLGRFNQTDPIRFVAGDANLQRYVGNNPGSLIDPTGLDPATDIGNKAKDYDGSADWGFDVEKKNSTGRGSSNAGQNKCSQFVGDVIQEATKNPPLIKDKDEKGRPFTRYPSAGEWTDPNVKIPGWSPPRSGDPKYGDVAAYPLNGGAAYSGHTGIVTDPGGIAPVTSAHDDTVYPKSGQFIGEPGLIFRSPTAR